MWALVGIGGDTLHAYGPDLATGLRGGRATVLTATDLNAALATAAERTAVVMDDAELLRDCQARDELGGLLHLGDGAPRVVQVPYAAD